MSLIRIDYNPSRRKLALIGTAWMVLLGILGAIVLTKTGRLPAAAAVWAAALLVAGIGWLAPRLMRLVYLGTVYATLPIALVVSILVLLLVYYLVLTPTGLLMRLFGYDPMHRRFDPHATTYWVPRQQEALEFEQQADQPQIGLLAEFVYFLLHNKKWWLTPIILVLLAV
ncbi:MAG: DUF5989 family protein, partial [Planctomycetota bacterium]